VETGVKLASSTKQELLRYLKGITVGLTTTGIPDLQVWVDVNKGKIMQKVYENQKMIVEVDEIDTVSVLNKTTESKLSIQVDDEAGFCVVYSEDDQDLTSATISPGGELEIICEIDDSCEDEPCDDVDA
jgi:hypothetical protein